MDEFLAKLDQSLPDLVEVADLVKFGIYTTPQAAYSARLKGKSPPYIRIPNRGIVYPKSELINFFNNKLGVPCT